MADAVNIEIEGLGMTKFGVLGALIFMTGCTVSGPDPIMGLQLPNPASPLCIVLNKVGQ
jgi:hypothetical protein